MNLPPSLTRQGWRWRHILGALVLGAAAAATTWEAWADIAAIAARDEESSHIFLVPIVALWMAAVRRIRLRHCPPGGYVVGPVILAAGWLCSSFGYRNAVQSMWHAGAVLVLVGALLTALGKNVLFRFLPAFAVLVFLVPVPGTLRQEIALPLQKAGAAAAQATLETFGVDVERHGNLLTINGTDVAVAEACNGMRMVFALVLVSYTFAYGMPLREPVRWMIVALSPLAAIACNVVRLVATVWLYGYAEPQTADQFHDVSGWLMLPLAFMLLLLTLKALRWALIPVGRFNLAYQ